MNSFNRQMAYNDLPALPPDYSVFESPELLKNLAKAARDLGELKGLCASLPDPYILINTIVLQESRHSNAIENIITTQDELYKGVAELDTATGAAKEVLLYREALLAGMKRMRAQQNLLTTNVFTEIAQTINQNDAGIRKVPGTALKNTITGEVMYTPPCCEQILREKLGSLEAFINDDDVSEIDPLIRMAMIHYQFEAIHPFLDGNGRTGRILNTLYLCQQGLLQEPVLYLSSYIVKHKTEYYQLLRGVTENDHWHNWVMFILTAVSETSKVTTQKIRKMFDLKDELEQELKMALGSSFNPDLLQLMFRQPYLKIDLLEKQELAHRQTASVWLRKLSEAQVLKPQKFGRTTYYINHRLMELLTA